jgi:DedD protein
MAEPADINVDELRRRARRRLVGAVVLALGVAVVVPMLLETEQKPLGEDVSVKIPPIDDSKFDNRLAENRAKESAPAPTKDERAKEARDGAPKDANSPPPIAPPAPPKYDTRIAETPAPGATPVPSAATGEPAATTPPADAQAPAIITDKGRPEPAKPAPAPPPRSDSKAAPAAPAAANTPASPPHEGFAVQLAAFADDKGANALAGRLKKSGYAAYTEPLKTSKGTLWRVRVGPYPSREAALAARDKLRSVGQSGIVAAVK